ncbi:hypothetical protein ACSNOI_38015, partial [Actinomadura kijaniata]|uniref:hypothetical protein n=1 Tax=Actinomadura kijaniata TaxID=46161 RepID=UPI003F19C1E6
GALCGALFGAVSALAAYTAARWRRPDHRGYLSRSHLVAARYDIVADPDVAQDATNLLIKHRWRTG